MAKPFKIQRILLIRLGGFGDVVFTLPAVNLLRSTFPEARISMLVYKEFAPLLEGFRGVDAVLTLDRERFRRLNPAGILAETCTLLSRLVRKRFDLVVDFQGFGETGWFSWLTRAPQRWGSVYRPGRKWAYTHPVARNLQLHAIEYHLDVLRQGGSLVPNHINNEFMPADKTLDEARRFFVERKLDPNQSTLFIQPFTSSSHKNWLLGGFIATARHWQDHGLQVLFGGAPDEQTALEPVRRAGFVVAAGVPLLVSAGLAKLSTLVLGGDTGLLHLAVAMNKRVIMIMGSLHPGACYPFDHRDWVVLPPNGLPVMAVEPEAVNRACAQALQEMRASVAPQRSEAATQTEANAYRRGAKAAEKRREDI